MSELKERTGMQLSACKGKNMLTTDPKVGVDDEGTLTVIGEIDAESLARSFSKMS